MGAKTSYKEVGGGPATGLANDFVNFLQTGLNTGTFGSGNMPAGGNAFGSTMGIAGVLNDILSAGGGRPGAAMSDMISKQSERDVAAMRARFGMGGGTAFGTPGAYAEALLRSETAPKMTQAISGLQLNALSQILPLMMGLSGKGITQRETVMEQQENPWMTGLKLALPVAGTLLTGGMGGPAFGAAAAGAGAMKGMMAPSLPPSSAFMQMPMPTWDMQLPMPSMPNFTPSSYSLHQ